MVTIKHLLFQNSSDYLLLIQSHQSLHEVDSLGGIYFLAEIINILYINTSYFCHKTVVIILTEYNYNFTSCFLNTFSRQIISALISLLLHIYCCIIFCKEKNIYTFLTIIKNISTLTCN